MQTKEIFIINVFPTYYLVAKKFWNVKARKKLKRRKKQKRREKQKRKEKKKKKKRGKILNHMTLINLDESLLIGC